MAALGLRIEDEVDELRTLRSYAEEALQRTIPQIQKPVLTVLADACNRCTKQQFLVTDACQSCIAKVCSSTCPKAAIDHHREDGRATIDPQKCVRCGQCVKVCPFHAIIDIKIPCVQVCPVGAITQHPDGRKIFDFQKCIYCGNCQKACPFGSVMPRSMMLDVLKLLQKPSSPVIALIAPAIVGHFGPSMSLPCIIGSIKRLGFAEVIEVSLGADQTAMEEAREFQERMHAFAEKKPKAMPFMTTSCCPAYVHAIKRHIPEIEDAVSATPTPMFFTAEMARKKFPGCVTVFIGPCDAKLAEAIDCPHTDLALTFTEIYAIIRGCGIKLEEVKDDEGKTAATGLMTGRGFAITGGVSTAVAAFSGPTPEVPISPVIIDGLNPASVKKLRSFAKKPPPGNLVEVMVMFCSFSLRKLTHDRKTPDMRRRMRGRTWGIDHSKHCHGTCQDGHGKERTTPGGHEGHDQTCHHSRRHRDHA